MYVPEYWVLVGAHFLTKQATKTMIACGDDEEHRGSQKPLNSGSKQQTSEQNGG